jgi:hypothetical protein
MMARENYTQKFICAQCGETIFVHGMTSNPPPSVCAICKALAGWQSGLGDRRNWPKSLRWSEELRAVIAVGGFDEVGPTSVHCIYLDANGRAMREP